MRDPQRLSRAAAFIDPALAIIPATATAGWKALLSRVLNRFGGGGPRYAAIPAGTDTKFPAQFAGNWLSVEMGLRFGEDTLLARHACAFTTRLS